MLSLVGFGNAPPIGLQINRKSSKDIARQRRSSSRCNGSIDAILSSKLSQVL